MRLSKLFLPAIGLFVVGCGGNGFGSGGSRTGFLSSSDWVLAGNFYADRYIFRATDDVNVTIDMSSDDFDTYLVAIDENNNVIEDDDSGPDLDARLSFQVFAGETFEIRATSHFAQDSGSYRLRWSRGLDYESELRGRASGNETLPGPKVKPKTEAAKS